MSQLWIINYKTDVGFPLDETILVEAVSEYNARTKFISFMDNCNENCDEIEVYDYVVTGVELFNEETHGPEHFYERVDEYGY